MDCEDQEGLKDKCGSTESEPFTEVTKPLKKQVDVLPSKNQALCAS